MIGGNNIFEFIGICEIDKTVVVRRKYGRGRGLSKTNVWLSSMKIQSMKSMKKRNSKYENYFLTVIEGNRSAENLILLIQQTTIFSDIWNAFNSIP